jgi:hypothetical protein
MEQGFGADPAPGGAHPLPAPSPYAPLAPQVIEVARLEHFARADLNEVRWVAVPPTPRLDGWSCCAARVVLCPQRACVCACALCVPGHQTSRRAFLVLHPLKVTLTNVSEDHQSWIDVPDFPQVR